jgi:hypothetical protein
MRRDRDLGGRFAHDRCFRLDGPVWIRIC